MSAIRLSRKAKVLGLPVGLAGLAAVALLASGTFSTTAGAKNTPDMAAAEAQQALSNGQVDKAIKLAEAVVAGSPREPRYRALLGQAYLRAGRFVSAATTFNDAMKLGDNSARTALGLALSDVAAGRNQEAVAILDDWRDAIPAADLGLALALAGETSRGVAIMSDALRAGDNTSKLRQNLAYAYALDGRWKEARVMAAQDVPADQIDDRISQWAQSARPEDYKVRIAGMIKAPLRSDPGQPTALALSDSPAQEQLAAETAATKVVPGANGELPPAGAPVVAAAPAPVDAASLAQYAPVSQPAAEPVYSAPAAPQQTFAASFAPTVAPKAAPAAAPRPVRAIAAASTAPIKHRVGLRPRHGFVATKGSHLVQLGSFLSAQGARRAWGIYAAKNPQLRSFRMTITEANVRGKHYYRVAAGGGDGKAAFGLCSTLKARGGACFAYATGGKGFNAPAYAAKAKPNVNFAAKAPKPAAPKVAVKAAPKGAAGPAKARRK